MAKIGRNQRCPCGSGRKYKHCCLDNDRASQNNASRQATARMVNTTAPPGFHFGEDDLDRLSNSVVDLINAGRLDEAEAACQTLKAEYPEVIDWLMRTAMLHEARGETQMAIDYYERTVAYMDDNPRDFDPDSREPFQDDIDRLRRSLNKPP